MEKKDIIRGYKDRIMSELSSNDELITALGLQEGEDSDNLAWVRFFPCYHLPTTQSEVKTYVTYEVDLPERRTRYGETPDDIRSYPVITFRIICHQDDMQLNLAGQSGVRLDYISEILMDMYDYKKDFGTGILRLKSNVANNLTETYLYRQLTFEVVEVSGICG